ncbi:MAG: ferrochelatase [Ignavibacteria bacterium RBG_16_34_14]|nr:MAG: ferrochelatase [Ignavibacteria bacterium RBG_16_34_14]
MLKTAVVLLNLGGPDSLEAVQPFLENLFNDPDIFKLPFQKKFAKYISKKRAPKVKKEYELIGGKSPINEWTEKQRSMLESKLHNPGKDVDPSQKRRIDVFIAMRYWKPLTKETVAKTEKENYDKIILLPLYPHYSVSTTGSSFNEWKRFYKGDDSKLIYIKSYQTHPLYLKAINERIDESLLRFPENVRSEVQLVFSAHGTPVSYVKKGDPYNHQIKETIAGVMRLRNNPHEHHLCFQSKVGPAKWLEPSTATMIEELASKGKKHLLLIPISFVSDHIETSFELDIEYRHVADKVGIENYIVMKGLNDSQLFVDALYELVTERLN